MSFPYACNVTFSCKYEEATVWQSIIFITQFAEISLHSKHGKKFEKVLICWPVKYMFSS